MSAVPLKADMLRASLDVCYVPQADSCTAATHSGLPPVAGIGGLWRGRMTCPEMLETAGDASKATAEVACGCELYFDRLS